MFPWGRVKRIVTEGRPGMVCFISLTRHPCGAAAQESGVLQRCRLCLALFSPSALWGRTGDWGVDAGFGHLRQQLMPCSPQALLPWLSRFE